MAVSLRYAYSEKHFPLVLSSLHVRCWRSSILRWTPAWLLKWWIPENHQAVPRHCKDERRYVSACFCTLPNRIYYDWNDLVYGLKRCQTILFRCLWSYAESLVCGHWWLSMLHLYKSLRFSTCYDRRIPSLLWSVHRWIRFSDDPRKIWRREQLVWSQSYSFSFCCSIVIVSRFPRKCYCFWRFEKKIFTSHKSMWELRQKPTAFTNQTCFRWKIDSPERHHYLILHIFRATSSVRINLFQQKKNTLYDSILPKLYQNRLAATKGAVFAFSRFSYIP